MAKNRRADRIENVMRILAIRDVQRINPNADFSPLPFRALLERNANWKVPVHFYVERKISRKAEAIGDARVVLKNIHIRVRKARVHVGDGAKHQAPKRKMDIAPGKQAVRDIGRLNAIDVWADHWNLERYKCIRERSEGAARAA